MSGTSLDGLDICYANFHIQTKWNFTIKKAKTIPLPQELKFKLKNSTTMSGLELSFLNNHLGDFIGESINQFISEYKIHKTEIDFISSHGHTIFHQPEKQLTLQIGNGANISAKTKLPVICDFRTTDIALKGNGAPLVPIGDQLLFSEYDYCINLGGISNISFQSGQERLAFDICAVNMVLNHLANLFGSDYDENGNFAKSGKVNMSLYKQLNLLEFYHTKAPKSLGFEWVETNIFPLLEDNDLSSQDLLRTFVEHIAFQISQNLTNNGKAFFTGGGTHNSFLIERIKNYSASEIIIPNKEIIDFKEALIFGFLGVLRFRNEVNILNSVTGASNNNVGGCIYNPFPNS